MSACPISYFNGSFLPDDEIHISPHDRGFVFADGTYEVFRSFRGKLFFAGEHIKRLSYSLSELKIEFPELDNIIPTVNKLLELNGLSNKEATIYLQITRGVYKRMHPFPNEKVKPTLYINVKEFIPYTDYLSKGVKCISVKDIRWHRCDIKTIALLPNILAKQAAAEENAYEAIMIRDGFVTEGTHTNVFGVKDGIIYTHPKSNHILSGISREIVIQLCKENKIDLVEKAIPERLLTELDELMLVGTSTEVMPVIMINDRKIKGGKPGPVCLNLQQLFKNFVKNYLEEQENH